MRTFSLLALVLLTGCRNDAPPVVPPVPTPPGDTADDNDSDGYTTVDDCDDTNPDIHPGAPEVCDGVDQDCDFLIDNSAVDATTWYADSDRDGYGEYARLRRVGCHADPGYVADSSDCDDTDGAVNPGASEVCNGIDDDCDRRTDDNDPSLDTTTGSIFYADADADGYGNAFALILACARPIEHVVDSTDCDDSENTVNPGATEVCEDGFDNDCSDDATECELSGTNTITTGNHTSWRGDFPNDYIGSSVALADHDGDGLDDVFIGSYGYDVSSTNQNVGRVYGYYDAAGTTIGYLTGISANDSFGYTMASVRDYDSDGDDELLVGAYLRGTSDAGSAYLFRGHADIVSGTAAVADATFTSTSGGDYGGYSLADAGDFDADGRGDILVSAYKRENGRVTDAGIAALFYSTNTTGSLGIPTDYNVLLSGGAASGYLGFALDGVGDVDGDGADDFVAGAYGENSGAGAAYLVLGGATGAIASSDADGVVTGINASDRLGYSVAGLGDTDGDGLSDWAVGADWADDDTADSGSVYIFSGAIVGTVSASLADTRLTGEAPSDFAGRTLARAGDVNGDGRMDLLIAATANDTTATGAGAAYLFYGPFTSGSVTTANATFLGATTYDALGYALAGGGDVDGDGYDDFLIGSISYDYSASVTNSGAVWLTLGTGI